MSDKFIKFASAGTFISLFAYGSLMCILHACNNEIHRAFSLSSTQVGVLFTMLYFGYIPSALLTGRFADLKGKIPCILAGVFLIIVSPVLFVLSKSYLCAMASVFVMGLGAGAIDTNGLGFIGDLYTGKKRTAMISFTQVIFGVGALMGPYLVGVCLNKYNVYFPAFYFVAVSAVAGFVFMTASFRMKEEKPVAKTEEKAPLGIIFKDRYVYFILLAILLYCGSEFGFSGWVAVYFEKILKTSSALAAQSVSVFWIGITLGSMAFAFALKKISQYKILLLALLGVITGFLIFLVPYLFCAMAGTFMVGFCLGPVFPAIIAYGSNRYRDHSGLINSIILTFANIAGIIFPIVIGLLADHTGIKCAMFTVLVLSLIHIFILKYYSKGK